TNAKSLSRILVNRLNPNISAIIHKDQSGFIPGRSIIDMVMNIRTVIQEATLTTQDPTAALLMWDQQKAYDHVHYTYMIECLEAFGFPPTFVRAVQGLYSNLQGKVLVNGHLTRPFQLKCGVRQGDPLSPLLYNITVESYL